MDLIIFVYGHQHDSAIDLDMFRVAIKIHGWKNNIAKGVQYQKWKIFVWSMVVRNGVHTSRRCVWWIVIQIDGLWYGLHSELNRKPYDF